MDAHIIDSRGVYLRTETVDPMGPQPAGAAYVDLPAPQDGYTLMWVTHQWAQVLDADVPEFPELAAPEPIVPQEVTMAQCRLALFDKHDIKTDADFFALVDLLPEPDRERAALQLRTRPSVRLDNPLVDAFCAAKGWDKHELFIYAATQ